MDNNLALILVIAAAFCCAIFRPFGGLPSGGQLYLIRSLFPSWRFFEDVTELPRLQYRLIDAENLPADWQPAPPRPRRRLSAVLFNSEGNFVLAAGSLLQQLEAEVGELSAEQIPDYENSVSYRLTAELAAYSVRADLARSGQDVNPAQQFQFRIGRVLQGGEGSQFDQFILSKPMRI